MANVANVRFYRLEVLPSFEARYEGIFVHVTKPMLNRIWKPTVGNQVDPSTLWMTLDQKINLTKWLSTRHIESIESGLWFGGENGWELLSNETNSNAINTAINNKIATLDVDGYAQAGMSDNGTDSTLTIKGIQEVDGKIGIPAESENLDLDIAIDGVYNESTNKIATQSTVTTTVTNAINGLNANTVQAVTFASAGGENPDNTVLTFKGIKETNGVIAQGDEQNPDTFIVGDAKLNIQIGSTTIENVFSANAKSNGTIKLDGLVFKKDDNNVISVITPTAVASDNRLVTEKDIANLSGAMHYKGALTGAQSGVGSWPSTVAAGDVYIVTTSFTHSGESNPFEVGDMIVFNTDNNNSNYTVVQSNITLGTGIGQVAANTNVLASGNLVVATDNGIETTSISASVLEDVNNTRNLTLTSQRPDNELQNGGVEGMPGLFHSVGITDNFTIMGRPMSKSFSISSRNRSISIEKVDGENSTDAQIDLIWNTVMDA